MSEINWIKLSTSIFDNRKVKQIRSLPEGDSLIIIWLQLLCLAGTVNDSGRVYITEEIPYTDQMLSTAFGEPLSTIQLALNTFQRFGMIDIIDNIIFISNWEKYQAIEEMEKIREQNRIRKRNQRERQKLLEVDMSRDSHADVTQCHATDIDKNKNKNRNSKESIERKIPTLADVEKYVKERNSTVDAKKFYEYYNTGNWKDAKGNPVKNWKQKLITWEGREKGNKVPDFTNPYQHEEEKPIERESEDVIRERLLNISSK